ncbi:unnamed protein product [Prorocentrum cordatum]|uniref:Uncharacterized protein n=1 Tax=Prorocentrum cordatum TaxID=2364126 RepID=A0ABN9VWE5_9DINO|nr:unnamed protein product [Polarella glacialis]
MRPPRGAGRPSDGAPLGREALALRRRRRGSEAPEGITAREDEGEEDVGRKEGSETSRAACAAERRGPRAQSREHKKRPRQACPPTGGQWEQNRNTEEINAR